MNEIKRNWVYCWEENPLQQKVYHSLKTIRDKNNHWTSGLMRCESCGIVKDVSQPTKKTSEIMKSKKTKNEIIVVGTNKPTVTKTIKKTKLLKAPRSPSSKESTVSYYDCMKGLVILPENDRVRITNLTHKCKCNKEEIQKAKAEIKHQLVHELARDYKNIGINLGKYVKADIVGCAKDLEN